MQSIAQPLTHPPTHPPTQPPTQLFTQSATCADAPRGAAAAGNVGRCVAQWLLGISYPLLILGSWRWDAPRYIGLALLVALWLQRWLGVGLLATSMRRVSRLDWMVLTILSAVSAAMALTGSQRLLSLYPALVNAGLFTAFAATLLRGPSMIEKFARLQHPDLDTRGVSYTFRVTQVWCLFFVANGAFSVYTALALSHKAWAIYNGVVAYALMAALLSGEVVWRRFMQRARRPV